VRVDKTFLGNPSTQIDCPSVQDSIDLFKSYLERVELTEGSTGPSNIIKNGLSEIETLPGWEKKFLFSREAHSSLPNANYTVNYLFVEPKCDCGFRHKIFVHLCFDNRQAIGTHLLRFKAAMVGNAKQPLDRPVSVAVVADSKAKSRFGWDNSAGTYEEFAQAIEFEYSEILDLPIHFLIVRS
jgi:hypothetical protein